MEEIKVYIIGWGEYITTVRIWTQTCSCLNLIYSNIHSN